MSLIFVEGNIGTGKTTFVQFLEQNLNPEKYNIIYEPVDEWQKLKDSQGKNILEHFYEDQEKWAFAFQMNSFISRVKHIQDALKANPDKINIIERSVFTDKYCFAKNCYESGKINDIQYQIYNNWHKWLIDSFEIEPSGFIYLKATPDVCSQRIAKRSRNGESSIPIEYLTKLSESHDIWLNNEKNVLNVESEENMYEDSEKMEVLLKDFDEFIQKLL